MRHVYCAAAALALTVAALSPATASPSPVPTQDDARFAALVDKAKEAMLSSPPQARALGEQAERFAMSAGKISQRGDAIATAAWLQAEADVRMNDTDHAAMLVNRAFKVLSHDAKRSKLLGDLLLTRGGIETAKPDVAAALADYQRAYNVFRAVGEVRSQMISLLSIASLYKEAKDYDNALKYYGQALEFASIDPKISLSIYNNRGNTFKEKGDYERAQAEFKLALDLARRLKTPALEAQVLRNLARAQLAAGKVQDAGVSIRDGMRLAQQTGDQSTTEQFLNVAALAAFEQGRLGEAKSLIGRAFAGVDLTQTRLSYRESHETAYKIYQRAGDERNALRHLTALKRLDDQATQLAASTNTSLMAAKFDYANQDLKIAKLRRAEAQRNLELERSRAQFQRIIFGGVVIATSVVVAMLIFGLVTIRRSRNEVRAANIDLASTNRALEKALAAKTEFLATTSHEIRTPLNGILGMTQVMLADRALPPGTRDRISVVHGAGVTMRALVDDILDVAKMETGNMTLEDAPFDLRSTLTDVSRMWQEQAAARGISFILDLDDCPRMVMGDAARLRQIVFNLLSNALKFTAEGAVTLRASADQGADQGADRLRIMVSDTGIGIPADKQELIFESFRQVDAGTTRKYGGTGLGLSICRNLAQAMGGDILVSSAPGAGASFTVDLPLVLAAIDEATDETAPVAAGALLIVDRNPITRSMLKALLEPRAGRVELVGSVADAVAAIGNGSIAQVVLDEATLKSEDDPDGAVSAVAKAALAAGGVSTAVLWGTPSDDQRAAFAAAGIDKVIGKPIAGAALAEMLYPKREINDILDDVAHAVPHAA